MGRDAKRLTAVCVLYAARTEGRADGLAAGRLSKARRCQRRRGGRTDSGRKKRGDLPPKKMLDASCLSGVLTQILAIISKDKKKY